MIMKAIIVEWPTR